MIAPHAGKVKKKKVLRELKEKGILEFLIGSFVCHFKYLNFKRGVEWGECSGECSGERRGEWRVEREECTG